jgi:hypothetical protein
VDIVAVSERDSIVMRVHAWRSSGDVLFKVGRCARESALSWIQIPAFAGMTQGEEAGFTRHGSRDEERGGQSSPYVGCTEMTVRKKFTETRNGRHGGWPLQRFRKC